MTFNFFNLNRSIKNFYKTTFGMSPRNFLIVSNKLPEKCIQLKSGAGPSDDGDACHLWDIHDGRWPAQEWIFEDNMIKSVKEPGKCIHIKSGIAESYNGDPCHLWRVHPWNYPPQEWIIDYNKIKSVKIPEMCIRVGSEDGSCNNGDECHLWEIHDGIYPAQEWTLKYLDVEESVILPTLFTAAINGDLEMLKSLHIMGANLNSLDESNRTALTYAVRNRNIEIVKYLFENGVEKVGHLDLISAAIYSDLEMVKYLHNKGADLNSQDVFGMTAQFYAKMYGKKELEKYLRENNIKKDNIYSESDEVK